ncbi:MAG: T9SS type A sorting domain-containing protein [Muribaculaceae bacterium]|nr:T9SS type A sorting domain-containing protein [Muribaculaceae bacterium]
MPTSEEFELTISDGNILLNCNFVSATLYDLRGVKRCEIHNSNSINTSSLPKGIYFIIIENENGNLIRRKVILP